MIARLLVTLWGLASIILTVSGHALPPGQRSDDSHTFQLLASQAAGQVFEHLSSIYNRDVLNVTATEAGRNAIIEAAVKEAGAQNHADIPAHELLMRVYDAESMHSFAPIAMEILSQDFQTFLQQHQEEGGQVNRLTRRGLVDGAGKLFSRASMATAKKLRLAWLKHSTAKMKGWVSRIVGGVGSKIKNVWKNVQSKFGKRSSALDNLNLDQELEDFLSVPEDIRMPADHQRHIQAYKKNLKLKLDESKRRVGSLSEHAQNRLQKRIFGGDALEEIERDPRTWNQWIQETRQALGRWMHWQRANAGVATVSPTINSNTRIARPWTLVQVVQDNAPARILEGVRVTGASLEGNVANVIQGSSAAVQQAGNSAMAVSAQMKNDATTVLKQAGQMTGKAAKNVQMTSKAVEKNAVNVINSVKSALTHGANEATAVLGKLDHSLGKVPVTAKVISQNLLEDAPKIVSASLRAGFKVVGQAALIVAIPVLIIFGPSLLIFIEDSYKKLWNRIKGTPRTEPIRMESHSISSPEPPVKASVTIPLPISTSSDISSKNSPLMEPAQYNPVKSKIAPVPKSSPAIPSNPQTISRSSPNDKIVSSGSKISTYSADDFLSA